MMITKRLDDMMITKRLDDMITKVCLPSDKDLTMFR